MSKNVSMTLCCALTLSTSSLFAAQAMKHNCRVVGFDKTGRVLKSQTLDVKSLSDLNTVHGNLGLSLQDYADASTGNQDAIARVEHFWKNAPWYNAKNNSNNCLISVSNRISDYNNDEQLLAKNTDSDGNVYLTFCKDVLTYDDDDENLCAGNTGAGMVLFLTSSIDSESDTERKPLRLMREHPFCIKVTPEQFKLFSNRTLFERLQGLTEVGDIDRYKCQFAVLDYLASSNLQGAIAVLAHQLCTNVTNERSGVVASIQPAASGDGQPQAALIQSDTSKGVEFKNLTDILGQKVDITLSEVTTA